MRCGKPDTCFRLVQRRAVTQTLLTLAPGRITLCSSMMMRVKTMCGMFHNLQLTSDIKNQFGNCL